MCKGCHNYNYLKGTLNLESSNEYKLNLNLNRLLKEMEDIWKDPLAVIDLVMVI